MEEFYVQGSLGKVYCALTMPVGASKAPLVIMSHGLGSNHKPQADYVQGFAAAGLAVCAFDFCGGGIGSMSDGQMTSMSVLTEAQDLTAVVEHCQRDGRFGPIFLFGQSQGGFVSAYVAAQRPDDFAGLAMEFPALVLQDDARRVARPDGTFPDTYSVLGLTLGRIYCQDALSFDIYDVIGAYEGDVLIIHGDSDSIVPLSYSQRAVDVYKSAHLVVMPGQNHGFRGEAQRQAMAQEIEFFKRLC